MSKAVVLLMAVVLSSSCGVSSLYYWGGEQKGTTAYENLTYMDYKTQTPEAICDLVCMYEDIVTNPSGTRHVPPPGICAEYGYLLLKPETASVFEKSANARQKKMFEGTDYISLFSDKGKQMLQLEIEYYPESRTFLEPLIKRLTQ